MAFKKKETSSNNVNPRSVFVGRTHELAFFINNVVKADDISHNIIAISGNSGVGKSTLLARFMEEAKASNYKHTCLTALINEQKTTPAAILEAFADQLTQSGYPLTEFDKALAEYKETLRRIFLFFDTFEQLSAEVAPWLLDDFLEAEVNISYEVVLVLAGRDPLTETIPDDTRRWLPYINDEMVNWKQLY